MVGKKLGGTTVHYRWWEDIIRRITIPRQFRWSHGPKFFPTLSVSQMWSALEIQRHLPGAGPIGEINERENNTTGLARQHHDCDD
jgi:hypothetical protein